MSYWVYVTLSCHNWKRNDFHYSGAYLFTSFVYCTNVYWSVIHGIKRKPHLSVVWNWYHFVAIAILHQPRPTDSADINTRLQLSDTSSIPPMHGGFLLVPGEFPVQRPVARNFDVFFDLRPNNLLSKQSWGWWFETPSHPLLRHRNVEKFWQKGLTNLCQIKVYGNLINLVSRQIAQVNKYLQSLFILVQHGLHQSCLVFCICIIKEMGVNVRSIAFGVLYDILHKQVPIEYALQVGTSGPFY